MSDENVRIIETIDLSLSEWLDLLENRPTNSLFVDYMFPSDEVRDAYLDSVHERSDKDVKSLLRRFLWLPTTFGEDRTHTEFFVENIKSNGWPEEKEIYRRLILDLKTNGKIPVWDGVQWVLDLLPDRPKDCLQMLDTYLSLYAFPLPPGRFHGLIDAMSVIKSKFIEVPSSGDEYNGLTSRQFEMLVAELFEKMGYKVVLTKKTRDGGKDVIAEKTEVGRIEKVYVEAKYYTTTVSIDFLRSLLGVISAEKINKGVLVTNHKFSPDSEKFASENPRIELIDGEHLTSLLNEFFGKNWPRKVYTIISERAKEDSLSELKE